MDLSRGAAIGSFGLSKDKRNLLKHHDEGRFIQQSCYGDRNGSKDPNSFACSYVAPIRQFPLTKGFTGDYEFHHTIGALDEIRERFAEIPE